MSKLSELAHAQAAADPHPARHPRWSGARETFLLRSLLTTKARISANLDTERRPHSLQVGDDEIADITDVAQVAPPTAGYMRDVPAPGRSTCLLLALLQPERDNKRVGVGLRQIHTAPCSPRRRAATTCGTGTPVWYLTLNEICGVGRL